MTRVRTLVCCLILVAAAAVFTAPVEAQSHSCNCWDGDMICVIYDNQGNITGWILAPNNKAC